MNDIELLERFSYERLVDEKAEKSDCLRAKAREFVMWANAAIARHE
jgi:hypothetical protein